MNRGAPLVRPLQRNETPQRLFQRLLKQPYPMFLDSGAGYGELGRYSICAADPYLVFRCRRTAVEVWMGGEWRSRAGAPLEVLGELLERNTINPTAGLPFVGGAIGYLGYEMGQQIERIRHRPRPPAAAPDAFFAFYDCAAVFDHQAGGAVIVSNGLPESGRAEQLARAEARADAFEKALGGAEPGATKPGVGGTVTSNFTRREYLEAVEHARDYITAGDVYQVNLAQRFEGSWTGSAWSLYERLRERNPSPFAAYLDCGDLTVLSASPERFLSRRGMTLETRPIKGTRPRGDGAGADAGLASELLASAKDRAEHIMIVDLERSDLGRVAEVGSVRVAELMKVERFPDVHHLTSTIRAQAVRECSVVELLRATFPGGSITGAPKIRAMEIIDELEPDRRGIYTGAIGYVSADGGIDLNIAIRTLVVEGERVSFHLGGGIVYDSQGEAEYQETLDKGRGFFEVLTSPKVNKGT